MDTVKNCTTIHLELNWTNVLEVVILFNDLSNKVCIPNKTEDSSLHAFNMTTGINESKILTKDISYQCKGKFDGRKCNSDKKWDNNKR